MYGHRPPLRVLGVRGLKFPQRNHAPIAFQYAKVGGDKRRLKDAVIIRKSEAADRASRNLQRRLQQARLGRFKPIADFDWDWPKKIDRELVERALKLSLIEERRNLILMGANGLGKTCIAKNIAYAAVTAGKSVIFRTASELISDLSGESPQLLKRKLRLYSRVDLLCIDVVAAILLATARRLLRSPEATKLGPIRSLHYFAPVIEEVRSNPLSESYLEYLRRKLAAHQRHSLTG